MSNYFFCLTPSMLGKYSVDNIFTFFFFRKYEVEHFMQIAPLETICVASQNYDLPTVIYIM